MLSASPCSLFKLISPLPRGLFPPSAVPVPSNEDDARCVVLWVLGCGFLGLGNFRFTCRGGHGGRLCRAVPEASILSLLLSQDLCFWATWLWELIGPLT